MIFASRKESLRRVNAALVEYRVYCDVQEIDKCSGDSCKGGHPLVLLTYLLLDKESEGDPGCLYVTKSEIEQSCNAVSRARLGVCIPSWPIPEKERRLQKCLNRSGTLLSRAQ